jgi:hypothetical protein
VINRNEIRADSFVLVISVLAILVAATLTMATISKNSEDITSTESIDLASPDPLQRARVAARAGIDAAKYHIECHGRISAGRLAPRYFANGATYAVEWDDVNLVDSTAVVRSEAHFSWGGRRSYQMEMESKIKLDFFPSHGQEILSGYYLPDTASFHGLIEE